MSTPQNISIKDRTISIKCQVEDAYSAIHKHVLKTPLHFNKRLSEMFGCKLFLKCENRQRTGSFKLRGAHNKLRNLDPSVSFVTSSTGNHGLGCLDAMRAYGKTGKVVVLKSISSVKEKKLKDAGAELVYFDGGDCEEAEEYAKHLAYERIDVEYVSPYNDMDIIAGQGTVGLEILDQLPEVEVVYVSVGGGGLMSGIASYIKAKKKSVIIVGVQPEASPVMLESIKAGLIIDYESKPTLSEGTAGGIEKGSITFDICRELVDDWVTVSEDDIRWGMDILVEEGEVVEGAAGMAVAAARIRSEKYRTKTSCVVLCGGNVSR